MNQCEAITYGGSRCRRTGPFAGFCFQHSLGPVTAEEMARAEAWADRVRASILAHPAPDIEEPA
jgi:hypothetical protein